MIEYRDGMCQHGHELGVSGVVVTKSGFERCVACSIVAAKRSKKRTCNLVVDYSDRILDISLKMETSMPWEREELLAERARLQKLSTSSNSPRPSHPA